MNEEELQEVPTDEEIFVAWRRVINRDRSSLRHLTDKLGACARTRNELRAEVRRLRQALQEANQYALGMEDAANGMAAQLQAVQP